GGFEQLVFGARVRTARVAPAEDRQELGAPGGQLTAVLVDELQLHLDANRGPRRGVEPDAHGGGLPPSHDENDDQAVLPSMRFIFVPQTGHAPWAADRPLASVTLSPSNSRFSRHFTQYPSYLAMLPPSSDPDASRRQSYL